MKTCNYAVKSFKMPSAVVILAEGTEEMEFVGSVDVLRRAGVKNNQEIAGKFLGNSKSDRKLN